VGKEDNPLDENTEIREGAFENGRWVMNSPDGKQHGVVIRAEGKSEITFELVYDPITKKRYTLAHFTDDLNAVINPYHPAVFRISCLYMLTRTGYLLMVSLM